MTILVAEDDPVTLEALSACLENEGYQTLRAPDGHAALTIWREHRPDLVCLDIMMPVTDGYEVCRRIRQSDREVPVLFLSAKNEERDIVAGLDLGADDFIRKPFTRDEVMARIRAALRRRSPADDHRAFSLGELSISPATLTARRDGQTIDLTPREVALLKLLHEHQGRPVTRDAFLDACWGRDYFPDSRTLDQHILMLRKKIEPDPASPKIIITVRGSGYRTA